LQQSGKARRRHGACYAAGKCHGLRNLALRG